MHIRYISIVVAIVITIINFTNMLQRDQSDIMLDIVQINNKEGHPCPKGSINWDTGFSNTWANRLRCLSGATKSWI